ncbi:MAG: triose-phosphate isomerase [Chloroflexi bacterium]|nr:triose-phosphate isomerase [Chloroflexota bacterium]
MTDRPFYFGTNFKMHQTPTESRQFVSDLHERLGSPDSVQLFVIPPYTSLVWAVEEAVDTGIWVGAQNMHFAERGAFTGEISAAMLQAAGVDMVMLGHAERRQLFGETDAALHKKVQAALRAGLRILLCVGENAEEKAFGIEAETVARQLKIALHNFRSDDLPRLIVAYEPVWSIGEGGTPAGVADVEYTARHIRATLVTLFGTAGQTVPLLYGGSVNLDNCVDYARLDLIDGLFVGRAAWQVAGYVEVFQAGFAAKTEATS